MASLTTLKKKRSKRVDPNALMRGELSKHFGLNVEAKFDIGTESEAKTLIAEQDEIWAELPVSTEVFFRDWIREPMYPIQQELCDAVLGTTPIEWPRDYEEAFALWGKGSGKDRTSAKMCVYQGYRLMCMRDPHAFFKQSQIDIANMSRNSRQAKKVYFNNLKEVVRRCLDPSTKKNWFEERGVDLREQKDIQSAEIRLCGAHNGVHHIEQDITCHSLDSEQNTGEGFNLFFSLLDELGDFAVDNAIELYEAITETTVSRYEGYGKVCAISFMYNKNDGMQILMAQASGDPKVFVSGPHTTWDVNLGRKKQSFARHFKRNPVRSRRVYECKVDSKRSGLIKLRSIVERIFNNGDVANPVSGGSPVVGYYPEIPTSTLTLSDLRFVEAFKPNSGSCYAVHVDLAKGKQKGDSVGFCMAHPMRMKGYIDEAMKKLWIQMGHVAPDAEEISKGVIFDLLLAIRGPDASQEVRLAEVRQLIYRLKFKLGFNIIKVTMDGYQSADTIQELESRGIPTELLSVDRTSDPYESLVDLAYQGLAKAYPHLVALRELDEVDNDEKTGKIDHPKLSLARMAEEGFDKGSKDVSDSMAGAAYTCIKDIPMDSGIFFG
jgi:hypothetical protein